VRVFDRVALSLTQARETRSRPRVPFGTSNETLSSCATREEIPRGRVWRSSGRGLGAGGVRMKSGEVGEMNSEVSGEIGGGVISTGRLVF
jgi:hypothetical protein